MATLSSRRARDLDGTAYRWAHGDAFEHEVVLTPGTVRECLDELARGGAGQLAYTPEVQHQVADALERRFETDMGNDLFSPPHFAPYEDPALAAVNRGGGWAAVDRPAATSEKSNVINLYEAVPDYVFPQPHPGWDVDRPGGFWSSLP
jgi:hypothetical protein